jgi:hypothetical protein
MLLSLQGTTRRMPSSEEEEGEKALPLPKRKQNINFMIAFIHPLFIN